MLKEYLNFGGPSETVIGRGKRERFRKEQGHRLFQFRKRVSRGEKFDRQKSKI